MIILQLPPITISTSKSTNSSPAIDNPYKSLPVFSPPATTTPTTTPPPPAITTTTQIPNPYNSLPVFSPPATTTPTTTPPPPATTTPTPIPNPYDSLPVFSPPSTTTTPPPTSTTPPSTTTTPPISDPYGQAIDRINQTRGLQLRLAQNLIGRTMKALLGKDCTYNNEDGSYSRPDDTGRYYFQPDGSIFYSGGTITTNTGVVRKGPMTLRNPASPSSTWDESTNGQTPLVGTYNFNRLDLVPEAGGRSFIQPGEGNEGRYLLQPDGSIFYEGGKVNGQPALAQTYNNGSWDTTKNTTMPGTDLIQSRSLSPTETPRVFMDPKDGGGYYYVYMLPDGKLLYLNNSPTTEGGSEYNIEIFENGSWTKNLTTNSPRITESPEIQEGIRAIRAQRAR